MVFAKLHERNDWSWVLPWRTNSFPKPCMLYRMIRILMMKVMWLLIFGNRINSWGRVKMNGCRQTCWGRWWKKRRDWELNLVIMQNGDCRKLELNLQSLEKKWKQKLMVLRKWEIHSCEKWNPPNERFRHRGVSLCYLSLLCGSASCIHLIAILVFSPHL